MPKAGSDLQEFLGKTQLFRGLPSEQLAILVQIAQLQRYTKGEMIFHQGSEATGFFMVKTGRVKVFKSSIEGKEQILHVFGPREHFAEVPAFDGKCFPASAAAIDPTEVVYFPRQAFLELLHQHSVLAVNLLISFARHLRRFSGLVEELSLKDVPQRLAAYLLALSDRNADADHPDVVDLDLTKGQLAAFLGTIPATLSRVFYRLSNEGMIAIEGSRITLLDRERLGLLGEGKSL